MEDKLKQIKNDFEQDIARVKFQPELESIKIKFIGRKGLITQVFKLLPQLPVEQRRAFGQKVNILKINSARQIDDKEKELRNKTSSSRPQDYKFDLSLPGIKKDLGYIHPVSIVIGQICELFVELGFKIAEGPEIETEYYNFEALNIPLEHPSRDAFDTFYLKDKFLLRSHTSPVQIRVMEEQKPPVQIIVPGKVYRPDATDASHSYMFHQVEGLLVDKGITFAHLKGVLTVFAKKLFGDKIKMRFRPHFFPFTEPSTEVDISCIICGGKGCRVCGHNGWLEILGAGMVHPKVFEAVNINSSVYSGFAFGLGIERVVMLKYGIDDIRLLFENDLRFIKQFS
ncbi:MAG: phenylalanine--tRNA ligase subunit alpha [Candidatus Omnitrophota bacterium]|nr:MAG: phenylalanine--tRNA ligase subunit alpha [Candidatus Omnitrophota bacterium]